MYQTCQIKGRVVGAEGHWPEVFATVPKKGEVIQGKSLNNNNPISGRVVQIYHSEVRSGDGLGKTFMVPCLVVEVELTTRQH